ncbi:MAG: asparagine synthase (glutamine-hydrolyzing) [Magnetovibrionaceae bacterium]
MCGIAGMMTVPGGAPPKPVLARLKAALGHRGPDGTGEYLAGGVGLVHTRLSIIDLETGDQPIVADDKCVIVANGEIYNYRELRADLEEDFRFRTQSDTEPALHLYRKRGSGFTESLRGMYALAIHDPKRQHLIIARDPFGIKPLYYAETEAGFSFASEPQALISAGLVAPELDAAVAGSLLQLQFTTGRETAFAGINRVLPGEVLVVEAGRVIERRQRVALPPGGPDDSMTMDEALSELDELLNDSVAFHQRSDVPYGMFLSGGIDSASLMALMAKLNDRPVTAFTCNFPGTDAADESALAGRIAASAGADHVSVDFTEADFWRLLPHVASHVDDPVADYATLPTCRLAEAARERDLKVILSGEGGDEFFAGYGRYRKAIRSGLLGGKPMRSKGIMDGFDLFRDPPANWRGGIAWAEKAEKRPGRSPLQVVQAIDIADWLPHDLLIKLDRCLMASGIEGRVPFIDPKLAAFAYRLADSLKVKGDQGKWLLRQWLDRNLPAAEPFAKKQGFTVPVATWIGKRGQELGPMVAKQAGVGQLCKPDRVEKIFSAAARDKKAGKAAWTLLYFALWHQRHIVGEHLGDDVMLALGG